MSKKEKTIYICQGCGNKASQWMGKCPQCEEWNSFQEEKQEQRSSSKRASHKKKALTLNEIDSIRVERIQTKIAEFDRVVGGGVTPGSLILLGGEPGIGKSTLLIDVLAKLLENTPDSKGLYVSGEESEQQIGERARRMGITSTGLLLLHETRWQEIAKLIEEEKPQFFILDSIQTTVSEDLNSASGTLSQIREVTYELMNLAKAKNITCFIIGHVTKEGAIAGPKVLEHMVDTVVYFEGDQFGHYRLLRAYKNRFGSTHEVGLFQMEENGLAEVKNPSQFFVEGNLDDSYGRALTCLLEGSRTLLVEIQALVVENKYGNGRRTPHGIDANRLAMLVAVVEKYFGIPLSFSDIYLNVVGGLKIKSREIDLAIVAAILSSHFREPIPGHPIFMGEVGLTGEVRPVPFLSKRLKELEQLNYKNIVISKRSREFFEIPSSFFSREIEKIVEVQKGE